MPRIKDDAYVSQVFSCDYTSIKDIVHANSNLYRCAIAEIKRVVKSGELNSGVGKDGNPKIPKGKLRTHVEHHLKTLNDNGVLNATIIGWVAGKAVESLWHIQNQGSVFFGRAEMLNYHKSIAQTGKDSLESKAHLADFKDARTFLYATGDSTAGGSYNGCRFIRLVCTDDDAYIIFKRPDNEENVYLPLDVVIGSKEHAKLKELVEATDRETMALTYTFRSGKVAISYSLARFKAESTLKPVSGRVMGIDANPNHLSCSIVDSKTGRIIKQRDFNFKAYSKRGNKWQRNKAVNDKRKAAIAIVNMAIHYNCEAVAIENLTMPTGDRGMGTGLNRLTNNQWQRCEIERMLLKHCYLKSLPLYQVKAAYSSYLGQAFHPDMPDYFAASVEIAARCIAEMAGRKPRIYPTEFKGKRTIPERWKHLREGAPEDLQEFYEFVKKLKVSYRFLAEQLNPSDRNEMLSSFRLFHRSKTRVESARCCQGAVKPLVNSPNALL